MAPSLLAPASVLWRWSSATLSTITTSVAPPTTSVLALPSGRPTPTSTTWPPPAPVLASQSVQLLLLLFVTLPLVIPPLLVLPLLLIPQVLSLVLVKATSPPGLSPLLPITEIVHQLTMVVPLSHVINGVIERRVGLQWAVHLQLGAQPQSKEVDGIWL